MTELADYAEAAVLREMSFRQQDVNQSFLDREDVIAQLIKFCPVELPPETYEKILDNFLTLGILSAIDDPISGRFLKIIVQNLIQYYSTEIQKPETLVHKYGAIGVEFLRRAVDHFAAGETGEPQQTELKSLEAPGADRIVMFNDNSEAKDNLIGQLQDLAREISSTNDEANAIVEDRGRVISELSAGVELLKSNRVRVRAILTVLGGALTFIATAFAGGIIGDLAVQLMHHLSILLGV
jgi:hypothetical protein